MRNLDEIMRKDAERRSQRTAIEDAILGMFPSMDTASDAYKIAHNNVKGARVNPCLVKGIGTVNPPAKTSASDNCWNRGLKGKTTGVATGTELTATEPTVLVIKGNSRKIVPVSSFRGKRETRAAVRRTATGRGQSEVARLTKPIQAMVD